MAPDQRRHPSSQQVVARRVEMRNQPLGRWVSEGLGNNETVFTISKQGKLNELKEVILFDALLSEQSLKPTPNANFMDETEVFFFLPIPYPVCPTLLLQTSKGSRHCKTLFYQVNRRGRVRGTSKSQRTWINRKKKKAQTGLHCKNQNTRCMPTRYKRTVHGATKIGEI